ncbi:Receptor-like kinase [Quillaja saponaria]|uniref:Receptor-like kinase n=1 Tax=Quillaja saponaria TaxID=32244 RepID=A0AAD7M4K6_QUISA|nr:Receptor-like kinase [Quillaja saponaria]
MDSTLQAVVAAAASFFVVTLIFAVIILACRRNMKRSHQTRGQPRQRTRTRPVKNPVLSSIPVDESLSFDPRFQISMTELAAATKNFSPDLIVGDGSFGLVYKAHLSNGVVVAIKKLDPDAFQGFREFRAEMETLGKLRHRNIVEIIGYCALGSDRLLVYEFIERGSLDYWLHDMSSSETVDVSFTRSPLSWEIRNKIIRCVANGLSYLHGLDKPIIHRDIKTSNVLLDSEFEAHIADFGLARRIDNSHSHVSTQVAGTMGYMPPEYREGMTVATVMADVYSFGILMLETATGQRPNLPLRVDGIAVGLVQWARTMVALNAQMQMVDPSISREGLAEASVKEYFRISCMCISELPKQRPLMAEIVQMLDRIPA